MVSRFLQLKKDDELPSLICSACLKKLLAFNAFRKQSKSSEYQLKLLLKDFKERQLLKDLEDRLATENPDGNEMIEYIDETLDFLVPTENDDAKCDGEVESEGDADADADADVDTHDVDNQMVAIESDTETQTSNAYQIKPEHIDYEEDQEPGTDDDRTSESYDQFQTTSHKTRRQPKRKSTKTQSSHEKKLQGRRPCQICGKMVVNLKPHMDTHVEIENRRKPYQCDYCGKEYLQRAQFDSHVNKEHTGLKPFKCDQCDKTFHGRPSLRMHKIQHSTERRFNCEYCPRSYLYAHHLSHHRYTHTKERLYSCSHCDYTNVHMENLKRHILSKHTEDEDKPYQCEVCSRSFNGQSNLKRHLKFVHNYVSKSAIDQNSIVDTSTVQSSSAE